MTLKEELEILHGEPIGVRTGNPLDIPCIETSDPEKLCRHPVVSVLIVTYNHEPYIRRAIEGVMMQRTDFEFELVIGEDASTDKTREICFEYQKKHPDIIRVLWWHENLSKVKHPAGGNLQRVQAHCRGDFIALCEGDDYWINPEKLQKQVDVLLAHKNVGWCFTRAKIFQSWDGRLLDWDANHSVPDGMISGKRHLLLQMFGRNRNGKTGAERSVMTATVMYRKSVFDMAVSRFEIMRWRLLTGDIILFWALDALSDAYCLPDQTAVYNRNGGGLSFRFATRLGRDHGVASIYMFCVATGMGISDYPLYELACRAKGWFKYQSGNTPAQQREYARNLRKLTLLRRFFYHPVVAPFRILLLLGWASPKIIVRIMSKVYGPGWVWPDSAKIKAIIENGQ